MHSDGQDPPKRALIVGGGFAGLAVARRLSSLGGDCWQATVLEGSERVGGRAHTVEVRISDAVSLRVRII